MAKPTIPPLSLADFVAAKKRADCPVCALPEDIRLQLREAGSKKKIRRPEMIEWLREAHKVPISDAELTAHYSGRHEAA